MKKIALSAVGLALAGMSTLGLAAPTELSVAQMDQVTAGQTCGCPSTGGGGGSLLNLAVADLIDSNAAVAAASNLSGLSLLNMQSAEAGNYQVNYSYNVVNQR